MKLLAPSLGLVGLFLPRVFAAAPLHEWQKRQDPVWSQPLNALEVEVFAGDSSVADNDYRILNFALSLEHLLDAFYTSSLLKFGDDDFKSAGYDETVRKGFLQIQLNGQRHVDFLSDAIVSLGSTLGVVGPCEYSFPVSNAKDFVDLSEILQAVAVSTYTGSLLHIGSQSIAQTLGSLLGIESRQSTWVSSCAQKKDLWDNSFETPTSFNHTWSITKMFATSCSSGDMSALLPLNLQTIPSLIVDTLINAGDRISLDFDPVLLVDGLPLFVGILLGKDRIFIPVETDADGKRWATIPDDMNGKGIVWIDLVQGDERETLVSITDSNTVAGPAIVLFPSDSTGSSSASSSTSSSTSSTRNAWSW